MDSVALHVVKPVSECNVENTFTNIKLFLNDALKIRNNLDSTVEPNQTNLHQNKNNDLVDQRVKNIKWETIKFYEVHRSFHTHTLTTIFQSITTSIEVSFRSDTLIQDAAVHRVIFIIHR